MHRVAPTWLLTSGFVLMSVGCLLCTRLDVTDLDVSVFVLPDLLIGVGFALCVSSVTAVALDSVPPQLAGMASATTNMLRDLGFALGPVVVGAVALSKAGMAFSSNLGGADLPTDHLGAARGIAAEGGPIAVNGVPPGVPGSAAHNLALDAQGSGFSTDRLPHLRHRGRPAAALTAVGSIPFRFPAEVTVPPSGRISTPSEEIRVSLDRPHHRTGSAAGPWRANDW
ncbi:hypothetical protein ABZS95_30155 [Streptomyces sp. NPDC005479]|uniref:hypothetical protein n=1 Tax=unclassified Streptomyces TaxID=2593676 RepID=UPI0033ABEF3F